MAAAARFELRVRVAAADIDQLGHVNNVVYLRWVQDAAVAHWRSVTSGDPELSGIPWIVRRHEIDYRRAARLGDTVIARTWVGETDGLTFERHTEILRAADGRLLARAHTLWCPVNPATGRVRRLDPAIHDRFHESASLPGDRPHG